MAAPYTTGPASSYTTAWETIAHEVGRSSSCFVQGTAKSAAVIRRVHTLISGRTGKPAYPAKTTKSSRKQRISRMQRWVSLLAIAAVALAQGCSNSPASLLQGYSQEQLASRSVRFVPTQEKRAIRQSKESCLSSGGILKIPGLGGRLSGLIGYGSNDCLKKSHFVLDGGTGRGGGPCPNQQGYSTSGVGIQITAPIANAQFLGSNSTVTIKSNQFVSTTSYTAFLLDQDQQYAVLFELPVGTPMNDSLTFTSPFQESFAWPSADTLFLTPCYKS